MDRGSLNWSSRVLVPVRQCRPEAGMLLLATLLLAAGIFVYVLERGAAVHFLSGWAIAPAATDVFGLLGHHLPTFLHTLAFILITAAILRPWPHTLPFNCVAWFGIECLFELGQRPPFDNVVAALIPAWFKATPVLEFTTDYFIGGTFDTLDIVSIGLGAAIAYPLVRMFIRGD